MAIIVGGTTVTSVTVNSTPIDSVSVNGTTVFGGTPPLIPYIGLEVSSALDTVNANIVRDAYKTAFPANDRYLAELRVYESDSKGAGLIFKDFEYIRVYVGARTKPRQVMIGTCTKSATLPTLVKYGTGRINYTTYNLAAGQGMSIDYTGDNTTDIFVAFSGDNGGIGDDALGIYTDTINGYGLRSY